MSSIEDKNNETEQSTETESKEDTAVDETLESLFEDEGLLEDENTHADEVGDEKSRADNVRQLLPVHLAPHTGKNGLKVTRGRGRPRKVERMPTTSDLEYNALMSEEKSKFIDGDPVYKASVDKASSSEILHLVKTQVAREAAALAFQRIENEKSGKDTAQVSSRRIDALIKIANLEIEKNKHGGDILDLGSESFQRVFKMLVDTMRQVAVEVLPEEQVDLLFNRFGSAMEGWEERAALAVAGKDKNGK